MGEGIAHRALEGRKVWGTMAKMWKENIPIVTYGLETWSSAEERMKTRII